MKITRKMAETVQNEPLSDFGEGFDWDVFYLDSDGFNSMAVFGVPTIEAAIEEALISLGSGHPFEIVAVTKDGFAFPDTWPKSGRSAH